MFSYSTFLSEEEKKSIHFVDLDETLFAHDPKKLKIHVKDETGKKVKSLTNQEFNTHTLEPGHSYDFSDFKSAEKLHKTARPIRKMLAKMKAIHRNGGKTEILTARSDFDSKEKFGHFMKSYGVDINKIHVRRAGNTPGRPSDTKKQVVSDLVKKHGYKEVHLYDDSHENLQKFLSLKDEHPHVNFVAHHVDHNHDTGETNIRTVQRQK